MTTRTAIRAGRAWLGDEGNLDVDVVVTIEDGTIIDVGSDSGAETEVVDARELTLLPGFIDAHVHIGFFDPHQVLAGGLTTVRDLAWPPRDIWPLVERSKDLAWDGPSILAAGPMLTAEGGYPTQAAWAPPGTGHVVRGPEEARGAVHEVADAGAVTIKIALNPPVGPVLDDQTLEAIVTAAHARGLKVTGHIWGLDELHKAIDCGVDELAHMLMSDESIPDDTLRAMVERDMTIVPTLAIFPRRERATAIDNLRRFLAAGGRVVYGTDLGNEGPIPGIDPTEVAAMVAAGMTPREVIASATTGSARYLGIDDAGVLAPGKRADIVGVAGDPLDDARAISDVVAVWRAGRRVR